MEKLFGGKVFLEVWVRVKRGWTDDDAHADAGWAMTSMRQLRERRDDEPAFVLHTYPYRETSLIVEAFTGGTAASRWSRAAPSVRARSCAACCRRSSRLRLSWAGAGELEDAAQGRVARRPAAADRRGAAVRVLSERAAAEAAARARIRIRRCS